MDALFRVMQFFSYPADYLDGSPSVERIAETLDKLEEDILGVRTAGRRGVRRAVVSFGEPVRVGAFDAGRGAARAVTGELRARVQGLLDDVSRPAVTRAPRPAACADREVDLVPALPMAG